MISQQEFDAILGDTTRRVAVNIEWREDADHAPAREFRVELQSDAGWPRSSSSAASTCTPAR
jgi:hypothetical protein